jgi:hypothetical protein
MLSNVKLTHVGELAYFISPPGRGILSSQLTDTLHPLCRPGGKRRHYSWNCCVRANASEALYCTPGGSLTTSAVLQLGIDSEYSTFFIGLICDDADATHSYWLRLLRLVVLFNVHVESWDIIVEHGVGNGNSVMSRG